MVYHNIYDSWSWIGGHADGIQDLAAVALRELQEETGVGNATLVSREIFSLEVLTVDGHIKSGKSGIEGAYRAVDGRVDVSEIN